jgi:hypothetical protein
VVTTVTISVELTNEDALDRCETGTLHLATRSPGYDTEAVLPGNGWSPLTPEQADALRPRPEAPAGALVELITLTNVPPPDTDPRALADYTPGPRATDCEFLACTDSPAGQLTTTIDHTTSNHLGIHLDNFDQQPTTTRERSRRRLAVNLGPGDRYLILATATIQDIAERLDPRPRYPHTDDVRRFLRDTGRLECIRIRMASGQGYIAPTELIPHDGSTHGATAPSRILFWLGDIRASGLEGTRSS